MNEESSWTGLGATLDRATDRINDPRLAARVQAEVHRRRRSRRGALAAGGAAAAVAIVIVVVQLPGRDGDQPPSGPNTPSVTPSTTAETETPGPLNAVQPRWDPFTIEDEPFHPTALPASLAPPAEAPSVADQPMTAAVIAWPEEGQDLRLLGTDGDWRSVPGTAEAVTGTLHDVVIPALSSDGRQVAMSTNDGILVVDVTSGEPRTIPWPDEIAPEDIANPWDVAPALRWLPDDEGFAVFHWRSTWLVGLDGESEKAPYGGPYGTGLAFDPDGAVIEHRFESRDLRVWQGDKIASTASFDYWGKLMVTRYGKVAHIGGSNGLPLDGGPMVLDAASGELQAYAPIRDPDALYTDNGYLSAKGFLDEDTLLLLVGPMDFRTMDVGEETWHLAAWDTRTGAFERLTSGDTNMRGIDVAGDVLAADWQQ